MKSSKLLLTYSIRHFNRRQQLFAYYVNRRSHSSGRFISQSLAQPLTNFATSKRPDVVLQEAASTEAKVTKLENGLTVASFDSVGASCTLGVLVNAGPRNEANHPSGVSHFLEKIAFKATDAFPSPDDLVQKMVACGGIFECQVGKDITIFAMSGKKEEIESLTGVLGEVVLRPQITPEEVENARRTVEYENQAMRMMPPPDNILTEMIHKAAFARNTFGLPKYCPAENLPLITRDDLLAFQAAYYRPEHMVVVAVGVQHEEFVAHVRQNFVTNGKSAWSELAKSSTPVESIAQYTGGSEVEVCDLAAFHQPMPEFAHIVLGLPAASNTEPQYVATAVLQTLMGGGGSFSAGGPGKGMFTRLFVNVLNQHHWVNSAVSHLHCYSDAGLFAISASAEPRFVPDLVQVIAGEMRAMSSLIGAQELARAKRQLQSTLLMNLEHRPVAMEDLGRQMLAYNKRESPEVWFERIEKVTEDEVREVANRMLHSKPSLVGFGRVEKLPTYEAVVRQVMIKERFIPRIFTSYK